MNLYIRWYTIFIIHIVYEHFTCRSRDNSGWWYLYMNWLWTSQANYDGKTVPLGSLGPSWTKLIRSFAVLPGSQKQGTFESMMELPLPSPWVWWDRWNLVPVSRVSRYLLKAPSPAWHHGEVSIETAWVSGYQSGTATGKTGKNC